MKRLLTIVMAMFFGLSVLGYAAEPAKKESKPAKKVVENKKTAKKNNVRKHNEKKKYDKKKNGKKNDKKK